jgi:uncharacterized protein YeaO (DUF488 family)
VTNYLEAVKHGKIYTSCLADVLEIRKMNREAVFVIPLRGRAWQKAIPINSRALRLNNFDVRIELAPTPRLVKSFKRKLLNREEFEITYALEMEQEKCSASINELAQISLSGIGLVIFGKPSRGQHCHRYVLGKLISKAVVNLSDSRHASKMKAYAGELTP